jgi:hypothetical protein
MRKSLQLAESQGGLSVCAMKSQGNTLDVMLAVIGLPNENLVL